ncbi:MAG: DivIVA domain-containing protein, partial [Oscillospiraceae bacterium]|nr:DivIVA domain-containing protein [Oscillospiraceae bacterium]
MLTPAEITGKGFDRVVFNGYDMSAVDEFKETVTAEFTALYKENAILKQKIKVLVEKVEEYRSTEDSMRAALLTAQRTGDALVSEAREQSAEMLAQADTEIRRKMRESDSALADEQERLRAVQGETAKFVLAAQHLLEEQRSFLLKLGEL